MEENLDKLSLQCKYLCKILNNKTNVSDFQQKKGLIEEIPRTIVVERFIAYSVDLKCSGITHVEVI